MYSAGYCGQVSTKLEFSQQIFEKYLNVKFRENTSSGIFKCAFPFVLHIFTRIGRVSQTQLVNILLYLQDVA